MARIGQPLKIVRAIDRWVITKPESWAYDSFNSNSTIVRGPVNCVGPSDPASIRLVTPSKVYMGRIASGGGISPEKKEYLRDKGTPGYRICPDNRRLSGYSARYRRGRY